MSKFSVYCVYDCSLQVSSDKPNLQFYARNVVCFTRTCDLSHIYIMQTLSEMIKNKYCKETSQSRLTPALQFSLKVFFSKN